MLVHRSSSISSGRCSESAARLEEVDKAETGRPKARHGAVVGEAERQRLAGAAAVATMKTSG
jgi:hypothetical protein